MVLSDCNKSHTHTHTHKKRKKRNRAVQLMIHQYLISSLSPFNCFIYDDYYTT